MMAHVCTVIVPHDHSPVTVHTGASISESRRIVFWIAKTGICTLKLPGFIDPTPKVNGQPIDCDSEQDNNSVIAALRAVSYVNY